MGTPAGFTSPINFALVTPGGSVIATTRSSPFSAPANVTARITADTSGGALKVVSVTSFITEIETVVPDPSELPPGTKPVPIKIRVAKQVHTSNGVTPLSVAIGQYVVATVQFSPTSSTPVASTATLVINGDSWSPAAVSIPVTATLAELSVSVPSISVDQGATVTGDVTVTLVLGADTPVELILSPEGSASAPNVGASLSSTSLPSLSKGKSAKTTITVSADSNLAAGRYSWNLGVWAYGSSLSFSVPVTITVVKVVPYALIKSKLGGHVIGITGGSKRAGAGIEMNSQKASSNDEQLWNFVPDPAGSGCFYIVSKLNGNVIDIQGASTASGALLDAFPRKTSGTDNQLWYFVADPQGSGDSFIVSKLNGNVIDIQGAVSTAGAALDAFPVKFTGYDNQLWTVVGGSFPGVLQPAQTPPGGVTQGNANYFLGAGSEAIYGLSVTVNFTADFVSTSNGYSFQLNCYSSQGPSVTTTMQQYVIAANPGDTQLTALINNWVSAKQPLCLITSDLANLPTPTIPKGYSFNITLNYWGTSALIAGATFTVIDNLGNVLGTAAIPIVGSSLLTTSLPATVANLAPVVALQFTIGGNGNGEFATLAGGSGTVSYNASVGLTAQAAEPTYASLPAETGESANLIWGWVPWPWSPSLANDASEYVLQVFEVPGG